MSKTNGVVAHAGVCCSNLLLVRDDHMWNIAVYHDVRSAPVSSPTIRLPDAQLGQFILILSLINYSRSYNKCDTYRHGVKC